MKRVFLLLLLAAFICVYGVNANIPTQPLAFAGRGLPLPTHAWSFRQSQCRAGVITEDIANALNLNIVSATCPTATKSSIVYNWARNGAYLDTSSDTQGIRTGGLNGAFAPYGTVGNGLTFEFVFTPTATWTGSGIVVLAQVSTQGSTFGGGDTSPVEIVYSPKDANPPEMQIRLYHQAGVLQLSGLATLSGTAFPFLNALKNGTALNRAVYMALTLPGGTGGFGVTWHAGMVDSPSHLYSATSAAGFQSGTFVVTSNDHILTIGSASIPLLSPPVKTNFQWFALYNTELTPAQALSHFNGGLPNSNPSIRPSGSEYMWAVDEDGYNILALNDTNSMYDADNDVITNIILRKLPTNGTLTINGVPATVNQSFSAHDQLRYVAPFADIYSAPYLPSGCAINHTSFEYQVGDGKCDGIATFTQPDCESNQAKGYICVKETNDPPEVVVNVGPTVVLADTTKKAAVVLSCKDRDISIASLGLDGITAVNQSNPELGRLVLMTNASLATSACTGGDLITNGVTTHLETVNPSPNPGATAVRYFCYHALPTLSSAVIVGTDTITYQCRDRLGAVSSMGTYQIEVRNPLIPGCGPQSELASNTACVAEGLEDAFFNITLKSYDGVVAHTNVNRSYRIDTLPTRGQLFHPANLTHPLTVGSIVRGVDPATGFMTLTFKGDLNYFNAYCANEEPLVDATSHAYCPDGQPTIKDKDLLNKDLCETPSGCPQTFSFSVGYNDGVNEVFSSSLVDGMKIWVLNSYDMISDLTAPQYISLPNTVTAYRIAEQNGTITVDNDTIALAPLRLVSNLDGDTRRVGFNIRMTTNGPVIFAFPGWPTEYDTHMLWAIGSDCVENGEQCSSFVGKTQPSILNRLIERTSMHWVGARGGNQTFTVSVYDPVPWGNFSDFAGMLNGNPPSAGLEGNNGNYTPASMEAAGYARTANSIVLYGAVPNNGGQSGVSSLSVGLWAGIAAAGLFVILSCFFCIAFIVRRARQGEQAALWIMKNILLTHVDVEDDGDKREKEISKMARGARRSLEQAVHADHKRMAEIIWCAYLFKCCGFNFVDKPLPTEEEMINTVIKEERDAMANKHRPQGAPPQGLATAAPKELGESEVVAEAIADDDIFDWERHLDDKTGRVFYFNVKTMQSSWTPPKVRVHESKDRTSMRLEEKDKLYAPKPPADPRPKETDLEGSSRVKKV